MLQNKEEKKKSEWLQKKTSTVQMNKMNKEQKIHHLVYD